jgi:hypothetical protein
LKEALMFGGFTLLNPIAVIISHSGRYKLGDSPKFRVLSLYNINSSITATIIFFSMQFIQKKSCSERLLMAAQPLGAYSSEQDLTPIPEAIPRLGWLAPSFQTALKLIYFSFH